MRNDAERVVTAVMPGDDAESHPMHRAFDPWANKPPTVLARMLEAGEVPEDQVEAAEAALANWRERGSANSRATLDGFLGAAPGSSSGGPVIDRVEDVESLEQLWEK